MIFVAFLLWIAISVILEIAGGPLGDDHADHDEEHLKAHADDAR